MKLYSGFVRRPCKELAFQCSSLVKYTSRVTDTGITLVKLSNGSCKINNPAERVPYGQIGIGENSVCCLNKQRRFIFFAEGIDD